MTSRVRSYSLVLLVTLSLAACAPKGYVMPGYEQQNFQGQTLVVAPLERSPIIDNPSDVADDLGEGVVEDIYANFFRSMFPDSLEAVSAFATVLVAEYAEVPTLESRSLDLEKGAQMGIKLPASGTTVTFEGVTPDVVLFVEDLRTERTEGSAPTMVVGGGMQGGSSPKLRHAVEYAYWDNDKGDVIAYGKLVVDTSFFLVMGRGTWESAIGDLARGTVRGGPLAR